MLIVFWPYFFFVLVVRALEYVNTKSDIPSFSRTTLVIWMVATTLLSARTQLPRPGIALMTQESVRFQKLLFKLLQHISCSIAASPFLNQYKNARARKIMFPGKCKTSNQKLVVKFWFVIKTLTTNVTASLTFFSLLCNGFIRKVIHKIWVLVY